MKFKVGDRVVYSSTKKKYFGVVLAVAGNSKWPYAVEFDGADRSQFDRGMGFYNDEELEHAV